MHARILKRGQSYNLAVPCEAFNFRQGPHSKLYHAWEHLAPPTLQPSRLLRVRLPHPLPPRTRAGDSSEEKGGALVWLSKCLVLQSCILPCCRRYHCNDLQFT